MRIAGRRVHIAGSASIGSSEALIRYAHGLVDHLVRELAHRGANFAVGRQRVRQIRQRPDGDHLQAAGMRSGRLLQVRIGGWLFIDLDLIQIRDPMTLMPRPSDGPLGQGVAGAGDHLDI